MSWEELFDYFFFPEGVGYDVPKTLAYGLVLVAAVYVGYRLFEKLKVRTDERLAIAVAPYVLLGSVLRVLKDMDVLNYQFLVTPGIYSVMAGAVGAIFLISLLFDRKAGVPYFKTMFVVGLLTLGLALSQLRLVNFQAAFYVAMFLAPWLLVFKLAKWKASNKIVGSLHLFDANTTFVSMSFFGYLEQHVLPNFFIGLLGPFSFVLLKLAAIVTVLFLIDRFSDNKEFNLYLKIIIGILGASTASRDFIRLLSMV